MKPKKDKWITVIVIWALVALALAFNERHSWIGRVQVMVDLVLVGVVSIIVLVMWVRRGFEMGGSLGSTPGMLGRIRRFALDEDARDGEARPK